MVNEYFRLVNSIGRRNVVYKTIYSMFEVFGRLNTACIG